MRRVNVNGPVYPASASTRLVRLQRTRPVNVFSRRHVSVQSICAYFCGNYNSRRVMTTFSRVRSSVFRLSFHRLTVHRYSASVKSRFTSLLNFLLSNFRPVMRMRDLASTNRLSFSHVPSNSIVLFRSVYLGQVTIYQQHFSSKRVSSP